MENSDDESKIHSRLRLWEFPDQYVIEPTNGTSNSYLAISRSDGSMNLIGELPKPAPGESPKVRDVFGVVGMLRLFIGAYLLVITGAECVGSYGGHPIFRISSIKVLACNFSLKNSSGERKKMETELSSLLDNAEKTPGLFFSYDVNLTLSAQRLHDLSNESRLLPLWRQADPRFMWNNYLLESLVDSKLDRYMLPIIQGTYQNLQGDIGSNHVDVTLIARRCTRRTGTRMWRRGADLEGYAANFVESEQILQVNGFTVSHVQIRGSIPLMWEQIVDLTYKPGFSIQKPEEAPRIVERHFLDLKNRYGSVLAVNLVNKHGGEGRLNEKYADMMQSITGDDLRYVHFDFHRVCGHMHFEKLYLLYHQIEDSLKKDGYFLLSPKGEKIEQQLGVVRTNCVDCLDRTNVTQSMIGRKILESQLQRLEVLSEGESISAHQKIDSSFKIMWANHGDDISIQYSGTPALKGDFVRYGRRTMQGVLNDGWNALSRYYLNNFADGTKQDTIDLLQGHYIASISRDLSSPLQTGMMESIASFKAAAGLVVTGLYFAALSLKQGPSDPRNMLISVACGGISLLIAIFVRANGRMFTNRPRLLKTLH